jgi:hypothetical protein
VSEPGSGRIPWPRQAAESVAIVASILLAFALDAAVASGEIVLLTNPDIREELATWRRALLDTAEDEQAVRRITDEQVIPLLARSLRAAPYMRNVWAWSFGQPIDGLDGHATLFASPELAGAFALRQFSVEFSADDLEGLLGSLDRTERPPEAELRDRGVDP